MFLIDQVNFSDDGYCSVLSFFDSKNSDDVYFIIQIVNKPSVKDFELGLAGVHFECCGDSISDYDIIKYIFVVENIMTIIFRDKVLLHGRVVSEVKIILQIDSKIELDKILVRFLNRLDGENRY